MNTQDVHSSTTASASGGRPISRAARMRWPMIVIGLLLTHASALLIAVKIAQGDPSMNGNRVDPRYHQRDARGVSPEAAAPIAAGPKVDAR